MLTPIVTLLNMLSVIVLLSPRAAEAGAEARGRAGEHVAGDRRVQAVHRDQRVALLRPPPFTPPAVPVIWLLVNCRFDICVLPAPEPITTNCRGTLGVVNWFVKPVVRRRAEERRAREDVVVDHEVRDRLPELGHQTGIAVGDDFIEADVGAAVAALEVDPRRFRCPGYRCRCRGS